MSNYTLESLSELTLLGPFMQTDNETEMKESRIAKFWGEVMSKQSLTQIPHQVTPGVIYGVYYDYESNEHGRYSFMLGAEVKTNILPIGSMNLVKIPAGKYAKFIAKGPEDIRNTWKTIWTTPLNRAYKFDFESYKPGEPEVGIYISLKL